MIDDLGKIFKDEDTGHNLLGSMIPDPTGLSKPQELADAACTLGGAAVDLLCGEISGQEAFKQSLKAVDCVANPAFERFESASMAAVDTIFAPVGWIRSWFD